MKKKFFLIGPYRTKSILFAFIKITEYKTEIMDNPE